MPAARLRKMLRETFGHARLRPGQKEVIESVLAGRNTLAIMPTGSGKSLCYQLPGMNVRGMTVVVSPLISLMKDQVDKLEEVGIDAAQVNSSLSADEHTQALERIEDASSKFIFTTPERLQQPAFLSMLREQEIGLFVIDEAHCIAQWGHDFRPAYLSLGSALALLGHPPVLALTATATGPVADDIARQLGLDDLAIINTGIYRDNLHYHVVHVTNADEKLAHLQSLVASMNGAGIIYAATIYNVEKIADALRNAGVAVTLYHGRLGARQRKENQEAFMRGGQRVMVATNAFGMGIDKPDIRFVIHFQIPASLEAYYQESGRAGRDGAPAECILLYQVEDKRLQQYFLGRQYPDAAMLENLCATLRRLELDRTALSLPELHVQTDAFSESKLHVLLKLLLDGGIVVHDEAMRYRLIKPGVTSAELATLAAPYAARDRSEHDALEKMVSYAQSGFCRWRLLMEYFGEETDPAEDAGPVDGAQHEQSGQSDRLPPPDASEDPERSGSECGNCDNCCAPFIVEPIPALITESDRQSRLVGATPAHMMPGGATVATAPAFAAGDAVVVAKHGEALVDRVEGDQVVLRFPDKTCRTFMAAYVKTVLTSS